MHRVLYFVFSFPLCGATAATEPTRVEIAPSVFMPRLMLNGYPNTSSWIQVGGRGMDTAFDYGDAKSQELGNAVRKSGVPRSAMFITTKVPCCPKDVSRWPFLKFSGCNSSRDTVADFRHSLDNFGVGYVDLLLMHFSCDRFEDTVTTWRVMESLALSGAARAIGISNFNEKEINRLVEVARIRPAVNQCGYAIGASGNATLGRDESTIKRCRELNITYEAYGAFGEQAATAPTSNVDVLHHPAVVKVANQHNRSTAQVALRWVVQQGMVVVSKSANTAHQQSDLQIFDFELSETEMAKLSAVSQTNAIV